MTAFYNPCRTDFVVKVPAKCLSKAAFYLHFEMATQFWHLVRISNQNEAHKSDMEKYISRLDSQETNPFAISVLRAWRCSRRLEEEYSLREREAFLPPEVHRSRLLRTQKRNHQKIRHSTTNALLISPPAIFDLPAAGFGIELIAFLRDCHPSMLLETDVSLFLK